MEYRLKIANEILPVQCQPEVQGQFTLSMGGRQVVVAAQRISSHQMALTIDGRRVMVYTSGRAEAKEVFINGRTYTISDADLVPQRRAKSSASAAPADIAPPMPAVVIKILVAQGERIAKGQALIVVAAMKMETTLSAPYAGVVAKIHVREGDKVAARQILMDIEKDSEHGST
ncbi:MAG: hypothetical protein M0036_00425 [Desulfobacteraceae bacterium]|nr:hypothetical protein [Desulfobacteraceae bacterium]